MIRLFIVAALVLYSSSSFAGFITGVVVGSIMSNNPTNQHTNQPTVVFSPDHDVISCKIDVEVNENLCIYGMIANGLLVTPYEYARRTGYKIVHKIGVVITNGNRFIIMEVGK